MRLVVVTGLMRNVCQMRPTGIPQKVTRVEKPRQTEEVLRRIAQGSDERSFERSLGHPDVPTERRNPVSATIGAASANQQLH